MRAGGTGCDLMLFEIVFQSAGDEEVDDFVVI